ncbi:MAG: ASKHA domain-containing protein [Anaerolineae bacterium]
MITTYTVHFRPSDKAVRVRAGELIADAARQAGIELNIPCGGQGRCGRCAVIVEQGEVRRRSTLRLSAADLAEGYALACQTVIQGDLVVLVPPQEKIERRLATDKTAAKITVPFAYNPQLDQPIRKVFLTIEPPSLADNTDDFARFRRALARQHGIDEVRAGLSVLRKLGYTLRQAEWRVTAALEMDTWLAPNGPPRLIDVVPGDQTGSSWGVAIDIGTTSNVIYLVDLLSGEVVDMAADYNAQIARGEDIISRIIYASRDGGLQELQGLVVGTLNRLLQRLARRRKMETTEINKAVVAGNSTMIHLFLALPPESIRLEPYVTTVNHLPPITADQIGLEINPQATVDCLPCVASYMGADITAGVLSSGLYQTEKLTLFMDIGTNGEMVLGDADWLIACACSAGPAFEGAGVQHGMRATVGAIEEVWINGATYEPTYRVIGNRPPRGICGSGLISLLAEMFITGVIDKGGNLRLELPTPRVREGEHGPEYVVAWADETEAGEDIVITAVDIDNLIRAKAAIYAGLSVLARSVGVDLADVEQILVGGAFGQYLNVEKAIQIGLLPDMPWDRFKFLGNTSVRGAYMALLRRDMRDRVVDIANRMTYLELSADNRFYNEFTSALFLPHTDLEQFPSVKRVLEESRGVKVMMG